MLTGDRARRLVQVAKDVFHAQPGPHTLIRSKGQLGGAAQPGLAGDGTLQTHPVLGQRGQNHRVLAAVSKGGVKKHHPGPEFGIHPHPGHRYQFKSLVTDDLKLVGDDLAHKFVHPGGALIGTGTTATSLT